MDSAVERAFAVSIAANVTPSTVMAGESKNTRTNHERSKKNGAFKTISPIAVTTKNRINETAVTSPEAKILLAAFTCKKRRTLNGANRSVSIVPCARSPANVYEAVMIADKSGMSINSIGEINAVKM